MKGADLPRRQTPFSAGMDFYAPEDTEIQPGKWTLIDTGVAFTGDEVVRFDGERPVTDWFMMIVPRSGLGIRHGVRLRNTVAIVDSDYRGNIMLCVTADEYVTIKAGDRFCQGIILPYGRMSEEQIPENERTGGMGSTGE